MSNGECIGEAERAPKAQKKKLSPYDVVQAGSRTPSLAELADLEASGYLEEILWPQFEPSNPNVDLTALLALLLCEKARSGADCWRFHEDSPHVSLDYLLEAFAFGYCAVSFPPTHQPRKLSDTERAACAKALGIAFGSLDVQLVRKAALPLASLPLWGRMSASKREFELLHHPSVQKHWSRLLKKERKGSLSPSHCRREGCVLPAVVDAFIDALPRAADGDADATQHCERTIELMLDLLSQLPTRRFTKAFFEDRAVLSCVKTSGALQTPNGSLLAQQFDLLVFFQGFEVDEHSGEPISESEALSQHFSWMSKLQRLCFYHVPELKSFALLPVRQAERQSVLSQHLQDMKLDRLKWFASKLARCAPEEPALNGDEALQRTFLTECIASACQRRPAQTSALNSLPLYPTDDVLFDESAVPAPDYDGSHCLALPKLNLQFLTLRDYLLRNFHLYRLESAHAIREHVHDCLAALKPSQRLPSAPMMPPQAMMVQQNGDAGKSSAAAFSTEDEESYSGNVTFKGQARMALPSEQIRIASVGRPKVGDFKPSSVTAEVCVDLAKCSERVRSEWESLAQHDSLFMLHVDCRYGRSDSNSDRARSASNRVFSTKSRFGLQRVRGGEVVEIRDARGNTVREQSDETVLYGSKRIIVLSLDNSQYQKDVDKHGADRADAMYTSMNVIVRRRAKESNTTAFLLCMRQLLEEDAQLPHWLNDVFLGYGDPNDASWTSESLKEHCLQTIDMKDTLLDGAHAEEALSSIGTVEFGNVSKEEAKPPFTVSLRRSKKTDEVTVIVDTYEEQWSGPSVEHKEDDDEDDEEHEGENDITHQGNLQKSVQVSYDGIKQHTNVSTPNNCVRFTKEQVRAIVTGIQPGLCQVVGPPGTGKTDVAAQTITCLLRNWPSERILLVTHSNAALNDLFEKLAATDVPQTKIVRLGHGEGDMQTGQDFSKEGRIDAMLARRIELLHRAEQIASSLNAPSDLASSCEAAHVLYANYVVPEWLAVESAIENGNDVSQYFKFFGYFGDSFFDDAQSDADMHERAQGALRHVRKVFAELEELRSLEVLQSQKDRGDFLLVKRAQVIAMTCTHAAIKHDEYASMGLAFDTVVMEESAKANEFEAAIPLLFHADRNRLKRVLMIGDDQQLPPVVTSPAFQRHSRLDQSLFTRLRRLSAPSVTLDAQGRCRPTIASLWDWKYGGLLNMKRTTEGRYQFANAGFVHVAQFIDVHAFKGKGEEQPEAHAFVNHGEAEYVVAVYQYMRLIGYTPDEVALLTTYRAQKHCIRDLCNKRCASDPLYGLPSRITTVDKFQGQQASVVLLSLVRTSGVGHIRDARRAVTALSRAQHGVYIFGRWNLFNGVQELKPFFQRFTSMSKKLALTPGEEHPTHRLENAEIDDPYYVNDPSAMMEIVDGARERAAQEA